MIVLNFKTIKMQQIQLNQTAEQKLFLIDQKLQQVLVELDAFENEINHDNSKNKK